MKKIYLLPFLLTTILFIQCKNTDKFVSTLCPGDSIVDLIIELPITDNISLDFPECFIETPLQGIDSYVGKIEALSEGIEISYDIGAFAGEYVGKDDLDQTTVQGDHEEFRYKIEDARLVFTFPEAGPANFYTEQKEHQEDLVELFKSLELLK